MTLLSELVTVNVALLQLEATAVLDPALPPDTELAPAWVPLEVVPPADEPPPTPSLLLGLPSLEQLKTEKLTIKPTVILSTFIDYPMRAYEHVD
jgi:hypothetical protein